MTRPRQRSRTKSPPFGGNATRLFPFAVKAKKDAPSEIERSIFEATEDLLQSISFDELTVAHILERAGISRTTFYRYFTSKHLVVSAMLDELQAELVDVMRVWVQRADRAPEKALSDAMTAVADLYTRHRPVLRAGSENWHSDPEIGERWVRMMDRMSADIAQQIEHERKRGSAPGGVDSRSLARCLIWGSERAFYLAGYGHLGAKLERDAVDVIVATWLGSIYHR
jgi:AcrR family transcriptional regulator